jgi:hypothetical protein
MTLDETPAAISRTRLLWMAFVMFVISVGGHRFLKQYHWGNCPKVWIDTGAFHNCVIQTPPPSLAESLTFGAFAAIVWFFFFRKISRRALI